MKIATKLLTGALFAGTGFAGPVLVVSQVAMNANDIALWSQIGPDQTVLNDTFPATSRNGLGLEGTFQNGAGSILSVVCPAAPSCSWIPSGAGLVAGDTLIVTSNGSGGATGPLDLDFSHGVLGAGTEIQVDVPGTYTAYIQAFNGSNPIGSQQTINSNANGDPLFIGLLDTTPEITGVEVGLTTCGGLGCDVNDFAVDSLLANDMLAPEPSGLLLAVCAFAGLLAWRARRSILKIIAAAPAVAITLTPAAHAQIQATGPLNVLSDSAAVKALNTNNNVHAARESLAPLNPLPIGLFSVVGYDGQTYQGELVGRSPWTRGLRTTTVQAVLIPLVVKVKLGSNTYTFDPTAPDPCLGTGNTAFGLTLGSAIFNTPPTPFSFNGVTVGGLTFNDAHLRGEFWSLVGPGGNAYHLALPFIQAAPIVLDATAQPLTNANAVGYGASCGQNASFTNLKGALGYLNINYLDALLQQYISNLGLQPNQFPFFVSYRLVMAVDDASTTNDCCILGYHNNENTATSIQDPGQTYGIAMFGTGDVFGGVADTSVMAHEVGEWINDPGGVNPTPVYSSGQTASCGNGGQNNLEVGDPLSGISNNHAITMQNGFTYHMQELAYFSWFFSPDHAGSLGAGVCAGLGSGCHSTNGTFQGPARPCNLGGGAYPN